MLKIFHPLRGYIASYSEWLFAKASMPRFQKSRKTQESFTTSAFCTLTVAVLCGTLHTGSSVVNQITSSWLLLIEQQTDIKLNHSFNES